MSPNTISLPKGPGSIEGLGESFQPTLNTGTAKYAIALKVPPGTAGQTPGLSLSYEGGGGNGPLGFGWTLPTAYIQRRSDKGIPLYDGEAPPSASDDWSARYRSFINDMKEELVPQADGFWFCKNEGAFMRYHQTNDHWAATAPDGTRMEFGLTAGARVQDGTNRVFSWLLERETDTRGNVIQYFYRSFSGVTNLNQKYLSEIRYGPGAPPWNNFHFVAFEYADRTDWFEDCRAGFVVRTGKRLTNIVIGTQGPTLAAHKAGDFNGDGTADYIDRSYRLSYLDPTNSYWSLLASVTPVGADNTNTLPPSTFGYSVCNPPDSLSASGKEIGGTNEPPDVMDNPLVELIDLNGDALPDILITGGPYHEVKLNQGQITTNNLRVIAWSSTTEVGGDQEAGTVNLRASRTGTDKVAHLADLDGNGLADLIYSSPFNEVFYFPNYGRTNWSPPILMAEPPDAPPTPYGDHDTGVRTLDVDFDKRMDVIQSFPVGNTAYYRIWFNLGNNRFSEGTDVSQTNGFFFSDATVQIADFNGDRIPDVAHVTDSTVEVTAGLGYGRFAGLMTVAIPGGPLNPDQLKNAKLQDITGDGLVDLVIERTVDGTFWYWINQGNYTLSSPKVLTGMPTGIGLDAVIRWADLNGNGSTDYILADHFNNPKIATVDIGELLNCGATPNTLTAISNGIGRVTLIGYAPSTQFMLEDAAAGRLWTNIMPNVVTVVASVTNLDSLGNQYLTKFRYHDGYYDPVEKQFRGFARVEQVDVGDPTAPTLVTRSYFDTGRNYEPMKGRLLRLTSETEDGRVFSDDVTSWTIPPVTLYTGTNSTNVSYAHPTGHVKTITELLPETSSNNWRRLESEFDYDNYGNQTRNADYGIVENGDRSAYNDERITVTQYALNLDKWIIRHPKRQEIQDEHGAVISRADRYYDDEPFGTVTIGNLTLRQEWVNPSNSTKVINAARSKYDVYGNPSVLLDPLSDDAPNANKGHYRQIDYDGRFHTYPVRETIHLGSGKDPLIFQAQYDEGFGTVTNSIDFNTNQTAYGYDTFARLINLVKPYDTPTYPTVEYDYVLAQRFSLSLGGEGQDEGIINYIETRQRDKSEIRNPKSEMYLRSRQFVDGLGRKLMTKQEAEPAPGFSTPRVVVTEATLFNARQKPSVTLNPYFSFQGGSTLDELLAFEDIRASGWRAQFQENGELVRLGLANAHTSSTEYDAMLREIRYINPDGTQRTNRYEPLVQYSFDENDTDPNSQYSNTPMIHHNDGLGRLVRVDEVVKLSDDGLTGPLTNWTTHYEYDLNDQLTHITDSQSNLKTMAYDGLKRKTFMDDPDRGHMTYIYDDASNLSETTDAKNQRITYTYDGANRILTEDYHDEGQAFSANKIYDPGQPISWNNRPDVAYFYDAPILDLPQGDNTIATARNTRGTLAYVWDLSGEEHTSYDARGRVEYVVKRIPDPVFWTNRAMAISPLWLVSYRTGFNYDSLDRMTRLVYPDNDEVTYEYNERSLVKRIPGGPNGSIISNVVYQPSAQQARIDYGNGVRTTYDYDNRLRLTHLFTFRTQPSTNDPQLINFTYDFDGVSNIKAIYDNRPGSAVPEGDKRRNTQVFKYDDLYRLTHVHYSFNLPGQLTRNDGQINYRYDRIGNMLSQTSDIQHFENGLPVTQLGDMSYGGVAGKSGRMGRGPTEPPGPHALTAVSQLSTNNPQPRQYPYDANGSMTEIDGLECTWDSKDRLVSAENGQMRADYSYDYTDQRISKRVGYKTGSTNHESRITTVYVAKHFELREHNAPTKYVFNGDTRVAQVIGSLSKNARVQRLPVYSDWNLCSLAVTGPLSSSEGEGQGEIIISAFKWNSATAAWLSVTPRESLPVGTVVWLKVQTNAILTVTGAYTDPTNFTLASAGAFVPCAGLEAWPLKDAFSRNLVAWKRDAPTKTWKMRFNGPLQSQSEFPEFVAAGEAIFVSADQNAELDSPQAGLRIRFYHQDHLRSSSAVTDAQGVVLEDCAYYPFGEPRFHHCVMAPSGYFGYTQKERDPENELTYFERRFYVSRICVFLSADDYILELPSKDKEVGMFGASYELLLGHPQKWNLYSYALRNPIKYTDPHGQDVSLVETPPKRVLKSGFSVVVPGATPPTRIDRLLFDAALNLLASTQEGARVINELQPYDVQFHKGPIHPQLGFADTDSSQASKPTPYLQRHFGKWTSAYRGKGYSTIDFDRLMADAIRAKWSADKMIRVMAWIIYHEIRHVENYDKDDNTSDKLMEQYKFPSLDRREKQLQKEINLPATADPATGKVAL